MFLSLFSGKLTSKVFCHILSHSRLHLRISRLWVIHLNISRRRLCALWHSTHTAERRQMQRTLSPARKLRQIYRKINLITTTKLQKRRKTQRRLRTFTHVQAQQAGQKTDVDASDCYQCSSTPVPHQPTYFHSVLSHWFSHSSGLFGSFNSAKH